MLLRRRSFGSTIDLKKLGLYGSRGLAIRHGREMGSARNNARRPYRFLNNLVRVPGPPAASRNFGLTHRGKKKDDLTELKVGHFFSAHIVFPEELVNSVKGYPTLGSGPLRAVYSFHPTRGMYQGVKRRPCLLYAKDHRTLTVFICTSRPPDKYTHRFSPFNSAPRLLGQPPAISHPTVNPLNVGNGYIFFAYALVARLIEMKYPLRDYKGPGGIVIPHFDSTTGDSWVPKKNYRLSIDQMKYIEELNSKFWQGIRYDEDGKEVQYTNEKGNAEVSQRKLIRRVMGGEGPEELLDKSLLPPMTARQKLLALNSATKASRLSSKRRKMNIARWESMRKEMLEVMRAHESERWKKWERSIRGRRERRRPGRADPTGGQATRESREQRSGKMNGGTPRRKAPSWWEGSEVWESVELAEGKLGGRSVNSKRLAGRKRAQVRRERAFMGRSESGETAGRRLLESRWGNVPMGRTKLQLARRYIGGARADWSSQKSPGEGELTGPTRRVVGLESPRRRVGFLPKGRARRDVVNDVAEDDSSQLVRWKLPTGRVKMEPVEYQLKSGRPLPREQARSYVYVVKDAVDIGPKQTLVKWRPLIGRPTRDSR